MADYDYEYYKNGAGKTALSLPTWDVLDDLNQTQQDAIKTDLEANDLSWLPVDTPSQN